MRRHQLRQSRRGVVGAGAQDHLAQDAEGRVDDLGARVGLNLQDAVGIGRG
jgi:hypothetical protein